LCPATLAGAVLVGWRALLVVAVCVAAAVLSEWIFCLSTHRPSSVGDFSALVTGLILALNLPASFPLWQAALGAVVAIVVVKCLFGGLGCNFANPALVGRVVLFVAFPTAIAAPVGAFRSLFDVDMVAGATPLSRMNEGIAAEPYPVLNLLLGNYGGMIGETCAAALLLGGVYLLARRVISWHIPATYIATVCLFSLCCGRDIPTELLAGGMLLGAIFMATDYVTSPTTPWGKVIFGLGCGLITMFIRVFCAFPEGTSFAILIMNILTPYIDKLTIARPIGGVKA
ncbi:MAG: RnfABCDGE type electron transport complex subunit D, partial [Clostridia bacterium]|nr:RnfABCDGE type electron transport complex subunit D [Clostridia bacterium]